MSVRIESLDEVLSESSAAATNLFISVSGLYLNHPLAVTHISVTDVIARGALVATLA